MRVETVEQFTKLVSEIEAADGYLGPAAFGVGLATFALTDLDRPGVVGSDAAVLDTWYPAPNLDENFGTAAILSRVVGQRAGSASYRLDAAQLDEVLSAFAPFDNDG